MLFLFLRKHFLYFILRRDLNIMIENLKGIHETVPYKENSHLILYDNVELEDYPPHWHVPVEIIMPIDNYYTVIVNNESYHINPYEILIVRPGAIHILKAPDSGRRYIFQADLSILKDIKDINSILSFMKPVSLYTPETTPTIYEPLKDLILNIVKEYSSFSAFSEPAIYSYLLTMLTLIGRQHLEGLESETGSPSKRQEYISKFMEVCEYIDTHCMEEITLDQMAEMANFSKFHFSRQFKIFTNESFYKYVNQKRIAYAETLLIDPELSITEIALECGFSSSSTFIRMFKIIKGCTPSEFRKVHRTI